jgi:hypothetical protein
MMRVTIFYNFACHFDPDLIRYQVRGIVMRSIYLRLEF